MGSMNFLVQMNPEMVAAYRDSERVIIAGRPLWATVAFAIGVFGGSLGSIMLLLRRSYTFYVLGISLLGVVITQIHTLSIDVDFSPGEILGIVLSPVIVSAFLVWYAKLVERKGWLLASGSRHVRKA